MTANPGKRITGWMKAARGDEMNVDPEYEWTSRMIAGRRTETEADGRARNGTHQSLLSSPSPDRRSQVEWATVTPQQGVVNGNPAVSIGIHHGFSNLQKHGSATANTVPAAAGMRVARVMILESA